MREGAATLRAGSLVDEFLERLRVEHGSSALTIDAYRRDLDRLVAFLRTRRRTIQTARRDDLVAHLEALRKDGLSARTLARSLAAVRGLYRFGREAGLLRDDPAALLDTPRLPRRLPRALSKPDAAALVEAPGDETPRAWRDRAMLELLYGSGLRASELVGLRPADVDLSAQILTCRGKRDRQRVVPIGDAARRALTAYLERARPRLVRGADPGVLFVSTPRRYARPAGTVADRAGSSTGRRPPRGLSSRAPSLVREPPPRGRRRSPLDPGPPWPRRHRHDRDLHPPPHGRRTPAVPPVPPASLNVEPGGSQERRRLG